MNWLWIIMLSPLANSLPVTHYTKCPDANALYHNETQTCYAQLMQALAWMVRENLTGVFSWKHNTWLTFMLSRFWNVCLYQMWRQMSHSMWKYNLKFLTLWKVQNVEEYQNIRSSGHSWEWEWHWDTWEWEWYWIA